MNDNKETSSDYGSEDEANFIRNMQLLREQNGWSQGEFAKRMQEAGWPSFHQTTVSRIEQGNRPVRLGEARGIAKVLGTITSQMILSQEVFVGLRELELSLIEMANVQKKFFDLVSDIDGQRTIVQFNLNEVLEEGPPEDMDPPILERRDAAISRARNLLAKSYNDLIAEYMEMSGHVIIDNTTEDDHGVDSEAE